MSKHSSKAEKSLLRETAHPSHEEMDMDEHSSYQPPRDFFLSSTKSKSVFDVEDLQDDDKELWLIRVPTELSIKDLEGLKLQVPDPTIPHTPLGNLRKGSSRFNVYRVIEDALAANENGGDMRGMGGQEMKGLRCLVPSVKKEGKLCFAPIAQHMTINQVVQLPDASSIAEEIRNKPVVKREHPAGLKMRFRPYGFDTGVKNTKATVVAEPDSSTSAKKERKEKKDKKEKKEKKKRTEENNDGDVMVAEAEAVKEPPKKKKKSKKAEE
ncbi:hypothetical protein BC936DRAFT_141384 [Jimgerdemannia flammicorona]|uniref:DNA-directed RNA polymerase I subunit RPA34.5-domain-containing protein n=1 Tax=Jimgerdemannia flammicorona TaxID=994334 RepID=A0A433A2C3_9FUNG|nr:hypothetical protein BC936DRAFT_141384 [Jimgerdemannia flammicorona]